MIDMTTKFARFAQKLLKNEYFIWLTTVDSTGTPQPRPVWYVWENDSVLIYSQPSAHKVKHIQKNPNVALHFNTEDGRGEKNVVILTGTAIIDTYTAPAHQHTSYINKYRSGIKDLDSTPEQFGMEYSVAIRVTPTKLRGWE